MLMEYRQLGGSGLKVPALTLGTGTFGGGTPFFKTWGATGVEEATRMGDICLEAGLNMFDSRTSIQTGWRKRFSAKPSRAVAIMCSFPPKQPSVSEPGQTTSARHD